MLYAHVDMDQLKLVQLVLAAKQFSTEDSAYTGRCVVAQQLYNLTDLTLQVSANHRYKTK